MDKTICGHSPEHTLGVVCTRQPKHKGRHGDKHETWSTLTREEKITALVYSDLEANGEEWFTATLLAGCNVGYMYQTDAEINQRFEETFSSPELNANDGDYDARIVIERHSEQVSDFIGIDERLASINSRIDELNELRRHWEALKYNRIERKR